MSEKKLEFGSEKEKEEYKEHMKSMARYMKRREESERKKRLFK